MTDKQRETFEAWAASEEMSTIKGNCGWYLAAGTAKAWRAWVAAQAGDAAKQAPAVEQLSSELASMTRMFHAACTDLGLINEALGLDPNDGGAEPILEAIAELKAERDKWVDASYAAAGQAPAVEAGARDERELPQSVLDALRFYAHGNHYNIDSDHQQFDTVSGEPQNWLFSERDDDCTMIEDGSIARAALCGGSQGFEEPTTPVEGEIFRAALARASEAAAGEPVAWVRKHPDTGELSGDWLWNDSIEQCRRNSGVWFPLGFIPAPQPASEQRQAAGMTRDELIEHTARVIGLANEVPAASEQQALCPDCNGTGDDFGSFACETCAGSGKVSEQQAARCSLGCESACLADLHGSSSECPSPSKRRAIIDAAKGDGHE